MKDLKDLHTQTTRIVSLALYSIGKTIASMDRTPSIPASLQHFAVEPENGDTACTVTVNGKGTYLLFGRTGYAWQYHLKPHLSLQDVQEEDGVKLLVELLLQDPLSLSVFLLRIAQIQSYLCWYALDPGAAGFDPFQLPESVARSRETSTPR